MLSMEIIHQRSSRPGKTMCGASSTCTTVEDFQQPVYRLLSANGRYIFVACRSCVEEVARRNAVEVAQC